MSDDRLAAIEERLGDALCSGVFYGIHGGYNDIDAGEDVRWLIAEVKRLRAENEQERAARENAEAMWEEHADKRRILQAENERLREELQECHLFSGRIANRLKQVERRLERRELES